MKRNYIIVLSLIAILLIAGMYFYFTYVDYYERGENDTFRCKVGETFKIKLRENGSTGCINCWLNEGRAKIIRKVDRTIVPGIGSNFGCDGCGGIVTITFQAVALGRDTIKMANCFVGDKKWEEYTSENTASDNEFIVEVYE